MLVLLSLRIVMRRFFSKFKQISVSDLHLYLLLNGSHLTSTTAARRHNLLIYMTIARLCCCNSCSCHSLATSAEIILVSCFDKFGFELLYGWLRVNKILLPLNLSSYITCASNHVCQHVNFFQD